MTTFTTPPNTSQGSYAAGTNTNGDASSWWNALKLRAEVLDANGAIDDVQMSLYNAVHGSAQNGVKPPYSKPDYYGEITYPSANLVDVLARVAVRLGSQNYVAAHALSRLSQGMGGGKSHGMVGLWHLAANPSEFAQTEIGQQVFALASQISGDSVAPDLNRPQVVVLCCDNMTAGVGVPLLDGPAVTLCERFLWRLFDGDTQRYQKFAPHYGDKSQIAAALAAVGRPVLILLDEIMDYVRQLFTDDLESIATQDIAFLRALLDTINDVPNVAMMLVMISSENDSMHLNDNGQRSRAELESLLERNGRPATVTSNTDFADILRRRLFEVSPPPSVPKAVAACYWQARSGAWSQSVFNTGVMANQQQFEQAVHRCFPFHPQLIQMAEDEWSRVTGFQRVRSTIRIFAATAYTLMKRAQSDVWVPPLIGTGDLPLSDATVREAVLGSGLIADERLQNNYRQLASTDIVDDKDQAGHAHALDLARTSSLSTSNNPRAAERAATALFLYSIIGPRSQGRQGATEAEIRAATFVPDGSWSIGDADATFAELEDPQKGLASLDKLSGSGGQPARYFLSTRQTLQMLFRSNRTSISDDERDNELAKVAESLTTTGPFKDKKFVAVSEVDKDKSPLEILKAFGLDDARRTRLVVLDPRKFALLNGADVETRRALNAALGIGPEKMAMQWASSCIFAVVTAQRRNTCRAAASDYIAWNRVCGLETVKSDLALLAEAQTKRRAAKDNMDRLTQAAFENIVYLEEEGGERKQKAIRLQDSNLSALNGTHVWNKLKEEDKVLGQDQFTRQALLANLTDADYGRPLEELRDTFWASPRMPLLFNGESDLQKAIFAAIQNGDLLLVGTDGTERVCHLASDINLGVASLRLARPTTAAPLIYLTSDNNRQSTVHDPASSVPLTLSLTVPPSPRPVADAEAQFTIMVGTTLTDPDRRDTLYKLLNRLATAVDEGASHIQINLKITAQEAVGDELKTLSNAAGATFTKSIL